MILEDDPLFALEVEAMLDELGYENVSVYNNTKEAQKHINKTIPDLLLLDVYLKGTQTGVQFAENIKELNIPLIFFTAHKNEDNYEKAKNFKPYAYLIKPFDIITLKSAVESSISIISDNSGEHITKKALFIRQNNYYQKINFVDILWVKSEGNYCILHTTSKRFVVKSSLINFLKKLPENLFIRVHRAYAIAYSAIDKLDFNNNIVFIGDTKIPMGGRYKSELLKQIKGK